MRCCGQQAARCWIYPARRYAMASMIFSTRTFWPTARWTTSHPISTDRAHHRHRRKYPNQDGGAAVDIKQVAVTETVADGPGDVADKQPPQRRACEHARGQLR